MRQCTGLGRILGIAGIAAAAMVFGGACPAPVSLLHPPASAVLVPPSQGHGFHGLAVGPDNRLYVGSVFGQTIYRVNAATGTLETFVPPPNGEADDLTFLPDGTLLWTAPIQGVVFKRTPAGAVAPLTRFLPGANGIAVGPSGKLYVTQVFLDDALQRIDLLTGAATLLARGLGGLNGFEVRPDGMLYGPIGSTIVKIAAEGAGPYDPVTVAAGSDGLGAVKISPVDGALYAVATGRGQVLRADERTGTLVPVATLESALDNLAFAPDGRLFVSNMTHSRIYQVNPADGHATVIVSGVLTLPSTLAYVKAADGDWLYLADLFALRRVNPATGQVLDVVRRFASPVNFVTGVTVNGVHVVVSSWIGRTVQLLERGGTAIEETLTGFARPYDAIEFADGTLVVAEFDTDSLVRLSPRNAAGARTRAAVPVQPGTLRGPVALAQAGRRTVYVSENGSGQVSRIDIDTGGRTVVLKGLSGPEGLAVAPDGKLLVVEAGRQRLLRIDPEAGPVQEACVLATDLPLGLQPWFGGPAPYMVSGVTVAPNGRIYVTSDTENAIFTF